MEISKEEKFEKYLKELNNNLLSAQYQAHLYWKISDLMQQYEQEINQNKAFWGTIIVSLYDSSILSLAKVYDNNTKCINFEDFLDFIDKNKSIFQIEEFKKRLQNNEDCDSLSQSYLMPSEDKLNEYKNLVSHKDSLVNELIKFRGTFVAHRNKKYILEGKISINGLSRNQFIQLLERGFDIINFYSNLYNATTYIPDFTEENDYESVFKSLKIAGLTLDFINGNSSVMNSEQCLEINQKFIEKVKKEIYQNY